MSARPVRAKERIVARAYELFVRHGYHSVGVDRIVAEAGVAKSTLYRHFRSKDELVKAVLARRWELWMEQWLVVEVEGRGRAPADRLLAVFDAFDDWFHRSDFEGCLFINSLIESGDARSPVGAAAVEWLARVRAYIRSLAEEAGVSDPETFADRWQLLMRGAIIQAGEGRLNAGREAKAVGKLLLDAG